MTVNTVKRNSGNSLTDNLRDFWKKQSNDIVPPIVGFLAFLTIWQILSSSGLTRLPGPLSVWTDQRTRELLLYPFYDKGGIDKGLFWQTMASLGRVAQGYSLAALVGIGTGILVKLFPTLVREFHVIGHG